MSELCRSTGWVTPHGHCIDRYVHYNDAEIRDFDLAVVFKLVVSLKHLYDN